MAEDVIQVEDKGWVTLQAGDKTVRLDLYEVNNRLADIDKAHQGDDSARHAGIAALLVEYGAVPQDRLPLSRAATSSFYDAIVRRVKECQSFFCRTAELPLITASTPPV